jgi:pimeloyl-ACP methyl ester carboxylesterase
MRFERIIFVVALSLFILIPCASAAEEELVTIPTHPGVTQSFLLLRPSDKPSASVILFAGGHGRLALSQHKIGWGETNFLVRNRERFRCEALLVAVMDAPSDRLQGLSNFKTSSAHAEDIRHVITKLKDIANVPVWLVGTSMGTVSAANAAARLKKGGPDGLVLTSTVTKETRQVTETVNDVHLKDIRVPTLIVHHRQDSCVVTPYELARALMKSLTQAPKKELLTFDGGDLSVLDPCEPMSCHGFLGLDGEVVAAIASWIKQF